MCCYCDVIYVHPIWNFPSSCCCCHVMYVHRIKNFPRSCCYCDVMYVHPMKNFPSKLQLSRCGVHPTCTEVSSSLWNPEVHPHTGFAMQWSVHVCHTYNKATPIRSHVTSKKLWIRLWLNLLLEVYTESRWANVIFTCTDQTQFPLYVRYRTKNVNTISRKLSYLLAYLLTPWCRVLLEKLTGLQLIKKFPAFHGTRRFIPALTSVRRLSLSWASPIQSTYPHPTSWRSILILSTHLRQGLPSGLLPSTTKKTSYSSVITKRFC